MIRRLLSCTLLAALCATGCHSGPKPDAQPANVSTYKTYHLRGKIVSTNPSTGEMTVSHEAIPGFMEAMTMPYRVKNPGILSDLHPGDVITADLFVSQSDDADVYLDHIVVIAQGKPDYRPATVYHVPAPGDPVPDFRLRNQDGRSITLNQFHGKNLLITFIYTRCPLPNFCPLVTHNFALIDRQLSADPALYGKTHLLCVSFDPENDTPARLRAYGATYIGSDARNAFAHWDFAVPDEKTLEKMALFFDIGLTHEPDSTITHTLSTTLIGADGKVIQFYPGNEWTVGQVVADVKHAAGA
ncbi:MAG TPA: SCO family protein [Terracidiphilus sp.]|nr:SCO family protein [Terracidiphilus sp.]